MGYYLHITRAGEWVDSAEHPITAQEQPTRALGTPLHARLIGDEGEEYADDGAASDWTEDRPPTPTLSIGAPERHQPPDGEPSVCGRRTGRTGSP